MKLPPIWIRVCFSIPALCAVAIMIAQLCVGRWEHEAALGIRSRLDEHQRHSRKAFEELELQGEDTKEGRLQLQLDLDAQYREILWDQRKIAQDAFSQEYFIVGVSVILFFMVSIMMKITLLPQLKHTGSSETISSPSSTVQ
jgi:hypothetical protein